MEKIESKKDKIRLDKYVNLDTSKMGLKFRNIGKSTNKAILELKNLIQTESWKGEYWEKPIVRPTSIAPTKEVIIQILRQESHSIPKHLLQKIEWIIEKVSLEKLEFISVSVKPAMTAGPSM